MQVLIDEIVSSVRALDGEALLDERVLTLIVDAVMRAIELQQDLAARSDAEQRITRGVSHELEMSR